MSIATLITDFVFSSKVCKQNCPGFEALTVVASRCVFPGKIGGPVATITGVDAETD